jgi:hypothetical protein
LLLPGEQLQTATSSSGTELQPRLLSSTERLLKLT